MNRLADLISNGSVEIMTGPFGSALHAHDYMDVGIPVVPAEAISDDGRLDPSTFPHISISKAEELSRYVLQEGDIVFARRGAQACGKSALVLANQAGGIAGTGLISLRVNNRDRINNKFLAIALRSKESKEWLMHHAIGATMPNLNSSVIGSLPLNLPSKEVQNTIAEIIQSLDDKIELNRRMNATLEAMARSLFQSWFVDFDPVRAKLDGRLPAALEPATAALFPDTFDETTLGHIPHGWEVKTLGEVIELAYGKPLKAEDRKNGLVCVYGANGPVGWHDEKLVSGPGIVVGRKGNPGVVTWAHGDFYPIDTTFYVEPIGPCRSLYFFFYALSLHNLANLSADSAVPGLNRNHAYMSKQVIPSQTVLTAFDSQLAPIFAAIQANEEQSRSLGTVRDTLLPKLLSGELSVPLSSSVE
jgi:type I restriction enzyme, S subunit